MGVKSYRDLIVWQKAMDLAVVVYRETACFPREETYGLRAQIRNAAASVPANIAEGQARKSTKEFRHFLSIAGGSLAETETHLLLAERLRYVNPAVVNETLGKAAEVSRLLTGLYGSLNRRASPDPEPRV